VQNSVHWFLQRETYTASIVRSFRFLKRAIHNIIGLVDLHLGQILPGLARSNFSRVDRRELTCSSSNNHRTSTQKPIGWFDGVRARMSQRPATGRIILIPAIGLPSMINKTKIILTPDSTLGLLFHIYLYSFTLIYKSLWWKYLWKVCTPFF
jgi:hypothetical protein